LPCSRPQPTTAPSQMEERAVPRQPSPKPPDLVGHKYGRLTFISFVGRDKSSSRMWMCRCECGAEITIREKSVTSGHTKSCGCYSTEVKRTKGKEGTTVHGMYGTVEWKAWTGAKERCFNPNSNRFHNYGDRGISMCDEWINNFLSFYNHIGPCPSGHSLDRIEVNRGYEPGNVKWSTDEEQSQNRTTTRLTPDIVRAVRQSTESISELSTKYGVSFSALWAARTGKTWANIT
jgi:hypothetical protein